MMRISLLAILLVLACGLPQIMAQDSPSPFDNLKPVPADWIVNNRLSLKEYDCSIETLGADWKWYFMTGPRGTLALICRNSATNESFTVFISTVIGKSAQDMEQFTRGFIQGQMESAKASGIKVKDNPPIMPSDIPVKGCSRKTVMDLEYPNGLKAKSISYIGCAKDAFAFSAVIFSDETESPELTKAAGSLILGPTQLTPPQTATKKPKPNYPFIFGVFYLILGFMVMGVCRIINTIAKRLLLNGAIYGLMVMTLALIAKVIWTVSTCNRYGASSERTSGMVGEDVGTFFIPAIVILIYAWRFHKKRKAAQTNPPTPA